MADFYSDCHRRLQGIHQSRALADRLEEIIVHSEFTGDDISYIQTRDFFFLSTVDPDGQRTVSYKGGVPGFVAVQDNTLVFPCYGGNGMFLSMGQHRRHRKSRAAVHRLRDAATPARSGHSPP